MHSVTEHGVEYYVQCTALSGGMNKSAVVSLSIVSVDGWDFALRDDVNVWSMDCMVAKRNRREAEATTIRNPQGPERPPEWGRDARTDGSIFIKESRCASGSEVMVGSLVLMRVKLTRATQLVASFRVGFLSYVFYQS